MQLLLRSHDQHPVHLLTSPALDSGSSAITAKLQRMPLVYPSASPVRSPPLLGNFLATNEQPSERILHKNHTDLSLLQGFFQIGAAPEKPTNWS